MLIDGFKVNQDIPQGTKCYLPFFSQNFLNDQWIFGSHIMSQYYMVFDQSSGISTPKYQIGFGKKKGGVVPPEPTPPGPEPPKPGPNIDDITGHHLFLPILVGILLSFVILVVCCKLRKRSMPGDATFARKHFGEIKMGTITDDEPQSGCPCFKKKKKSTIATDKKYGELADWGDASFSRKQRDIWGEGHGILR